MLEGWVGVWTFQAWGGVVSWEGVKSGGSREGLRGSLGQVCSHSLPPLFA